MEEILLVVLVVFPVEEMVVLVEFEVERVVVEFL
jgi:hypothetical protein